MKDGKNIYYFILLILTIFLNFVTSIWHKIINGYELSNGELSIIIFTGIILLIPFLESRHEK
jgi:hypothetical protein